jgi:hypothetical protein
MPWRGFRAAKRPARLAAERASWRRGCVAEERSLCDEESGSKRNHKNAPRQDLLLCEVRLDIRRYLIDYARRRASPTEERLGREVRDSLRRQNLKRIAIDSFAKGRVFSVACGEAGQPVALTLRSVCQCAHACLAERSGRIPIDRRLERLVPLEPGVKLVYRRFCVVYRSRHAATRFLTPMITDYGAIGSAEQDVWQTRILP